MSGYRFRAALAVGVAMLTLATASSPARAQWIVYDPTNFSQNVLTAARELQQVNQNIQSLENQATMLINQAKNLASLPYSSLAQLEASIQRTEQLLMQAQNIAYSVTTIDQAFTAAAQGLEGEDAMAAMGLAYLELLQDPDLLQVQLHGFAAAAADPDIARACQDTFRRLWMLVRNYADVTPQQMRDFFAHGMLCSVMAAIDLVSVPEPWAQSFFDDLAEEEKKVALQKLGRGSASTVAVSAALAADTAS